MSLFSRRVEPPHGLNIILRDNFSLEINHAQIELGAGESLAGRFAVPDDGFLVVFRHTHAV